MTPHLRRVLFACSSSPSQRKLVRTGLATRQATLYTHDKYPNRRLLYYNVKSYTWVYTDKSGVNHDFPSGDFVTTVRSTNPHIICEGAETITLNAWSTDGAGYFIHASGQLATISLGGSVFPKYRVLSVIYAPPGVEKLCGLQVKVRLSARRIPALGQLVSDEQPQ